MRDLIYKQLEQAIEPIINHLKLGHHMNRCHSKGAEGDAIHAMLCAADYNIRLVTENDLK